MAQSTELPDTGEEGSETRILERKPEYRGFPRVYLESREPVLAAYLLELAEEKGIEVPFPAALFWALYESRMAIRLQQYQPSPDRSAGSGRGGSGGYRGHG